MLLVLTASCLPCYPVLVVILFTIVLRFVGHRRRLRLPKRHRSGSKCPLPIYPALAAARTSAIRPSPRPFQAFAPLPALRASQQPATAGRRRQTNRSEKKILHASSRSARHPAASRVFRRGGPLYTHKSQPTDGTHSRRRASRSLAPLRALTPAMPCTTPSRCCRPSNLIQSSALAHSVESPGSYLGTAGSRDFPCRPPSGALEAQSLLRHLSQSPPLAKGGDGRRSLQVRGRRRADHGLQMAQTWQRLLPAATWRRACKMLGGKAAQVEVCQAREAQ